MGREDLKINDQRKEGESGGFLVADTRLFKPVFELVGQLAVHPFVGLLVYPSIKKSLYLDFCSCLPIE